MSEQQVVTGGSVRQFRTGPLPVLTAAALWGTTGTAATFAPPGASALSIGAATMGFGGLLLLAIAGKSALSVLRSGNMTLVLAGALAVAAYPLAFYSSMAVAGVAIGTVVTLGSAPVFAALIERLADGVRLDQTWTVATTVSVLGGFLLVTGGSPLDGTGSSVLGVLLGLLAGCSYSGYSWAAGRLMRNGHRSRPVMGAMFGAGSVVLLPVLALTGGPLMTSASGLLVAGYLAVVPMGLAYVLFGTGLRHTTVRVATTLSLLEPVVAALLSVLVVGEHLSPQSWLGMVLIGAGLVLVSSRQPR